MRLQSRIAERKAQGYTLALHVSHSVTQTGLQTLWSALVVLGKPAGD